MHAIAPKNIKEVESVMEEDYSRSKELLAKMIRRMEMEQSVLENLKKYDEMNMKTEHLNKLKALLVQEEPRPDVQVRKLDVQKERSDLEAAFKAAHSGSAVEMNFDQLEMERFGYFDTCGYETMKNFIRGEGKVLVEEITLASFKNDQEKLAELLKELHAWVVKVAGQDGVAGWKGQRQWSQGGKTLEEAEHTTPVSYKVGLFTSLGSTSTMNKTVARLNTLARYPLEYLKGAIEKEVTRKVGRKLLWDGQLVKNYFILPVMLWMGCVDVLTKRMTIMKNEKINPATEAYDVEEAKAYLLDKLMPLMKNLSADWMRGTFFSFDRLTV